MEYSWCDSEKDEINSPFSQQLFAKISTISSSSVGPLNNRMTCSESNGKVENIDSITMDREQTHLKVLTFLGDQYLKEKQYRTLNVLCLAISSAHVLVDNKPICQHPLVVRLM